MEKQQTEITQLRQQLAESRGLVESLQKRQDDLETALEQQRQINMILEERLMHIRLPTDKIKAVMSCDPRSLVVPDGTEVLRKDEFKETNYERLFVPRSVAEIRDGLFANCKCLREVVFEDGSTLKSIGESAFCNCKSLRAVRLPPGLERIGRFCFYGSGLEELVAPQGLKEIGGGAFDSCYGLKRVVLNEGL